MDHTASSGGRHCRDNYVGMSLDKPWHQAVHQRAVERRARNAARRALGTLWRRVHVGSGEPMKEAVLVTDGH